MKAVVLAGGLGTRLHPLTINTPKPMVPVANRPIMSYTMELLNKHGFNDIYVLLYHQPGKIKDHFKDGKQLGSKITYIEAPKDYGTAGAVKFALKSIKEPVLVISADLITNIDLSKVIAFHKEKKSHVTIVLTRVNNPISYGIVITDKNSRIQKFLEKPSWSEVFSDTINAGIYVIEPSMLEYVPDEKTFDFSQDLFPRLLDDKKDLFGFIADGYWEDVGKLDDYSKANSDVLSKDLGFSNRGKKIAGSEILVGTDVIISSSAMLQGIGSIDDGSIVADDTVILNSVIGKNCTIGKRSYIKDCILWDGAQVGSEAKLEKAVLGNKTKVGDRANINEGVVIGDNSVIEKDSEIKHFIKIWPNKTVEEGSIVSKSIVWRERFAKSIFGPYGITGACNVDITPEFAASIGAAYGSMLGKGVRITCSRDSHKASRMIYRALISGALSSGVDVSDLEMVPIPLNRYELHFLKSQGGFHVRRSPYDYEVIDIKFFDTNGLDIDSIKEKKVERLFFSESFSRATVDACGELTFPFHRVAEAYKEGMLNYLDKDAIKNCGNKIVIDYAFGAASQIFPSILGELGLDVVSINAYIDENKITKNEAEFKKSLTQLSQIVKSLGANLGIMLDSGAEKIFLCDEKGNIIDGGKALTVLSYLTLKAKKGSTIAVPVSESKAIEDIAKKHGGHVVRTKTNLRSMMEAALTGNISMVGESLGGFIYPEFISSFDGMLSTCKLIECLCREKTPLSIISDGLPEVQIYKRDIPCSADQKGKVMRILVDRSDEADRVDLIDGVKLWYDDDWILVLPDPVQPVIHLFAEAVTDHKARLLLDKYAGNIQAIKEG